MHKAVGGHKVKIRHATSEERVYGSELRRPRSVLIAGATLSLRVNRGWMDAYT